MVGGHDADRPAHQPVTQRLPVGVEAHGRRHLHRRAPSRVVLLGQPEVRGAGLGAQRGACAACLFDCAKAQGARQVGDVHPDSELPCHGRRRRDRDRLGLRRPRRKDVVVAIQRPAEGVQHRGILGVDGDGETELGEDRPKPGERAVIGRRLEVRVAQLG